MSSRRVVGALAAATAGVSLLGAGAAGLSMEHSAMDLVLLQLVFYGTWSCLVGALVGGALGAAIEEDACAELDMGVMSSVGSLLGTLSAGLIGTALPGLALLGPWQAVWAGFGALGMLHLALWWVWPWRLVRISEAPQGLRMRDRVAVLLTANVLVILLLTLAMALRMGRDLGHPVMMAPMMYGMFGTMLGGMLGGWLAGLLDEHRGAPQHDNSVMVSAMALMAGMMGGMPSGMIGGMMAVMGLPAIALTVGAGLLLIALVVWVALRGRYRLAV